MTMSPGIVRAKTHLSGCVGGTLLCGGGPVTRPGGADGRGRRQPPPDGLRSKPEGERLRVRWVGAAAGTHRTRKLLAVFAIPCAPPSYGCTWHGKDRADGR